jgi:hypothetical protein
MDKEEREVPAQLGAGISIVALGEAQTRYVISRRTTNMWNLRRRIARL